MDWTNKNVNPSKVVLVGDEPEVMVLDVDGDRRRISLGIKQVTSNPWETFAAIHKKGDKVVSQIKSITDFGIFIGLDGGIDGLIHLSDMSWNYTGEDVARELKKGDTLEAVVLAVAPEREIARAYGRVRAWKYLGISMFEDELNKKNTIYKIECE